jgi:hypothetical protein
LLAGIHNHAWQLAMPLDGLLLNGLLQIFVALDRLPTLTA